MKELLIPGIKLFAICFGAALSLGFVNEITKDKIASGKALKEQEAISSFAIDGELGTMLPVPPGYASSEQVRKMSIIEKETLESGKIITGYVLELHGQGYGGDMKLFAYYSPDGRVLDSRLVEEKETPGLGKKALEPEYMDKFKNMSGKEIPVAKSMLSNPDAVTGATITFMGVANALRAGSRYLASLGAQQ